MISSYPPAIRRQLLSKHFLISTMLEGALDDLVKFTTVARFEPHRVILSKGDKAIVFMASCRAAYGSTPLPRFAADSTLEEGEFEPLVPLYLRRRRFSEHLSGLPRAASARIRTRAERYAQ